MKPLGRKRRKLYPDLGGHQYCGVCREENKLPTREREKQFIKEEIDMALPPMQKVFESRFHGQVYTLDGIGYDVPRLTYWCQSTLPVEQIPLKDLQMSKSDEKHGSDEFKAHAADLEQEDVPPIVTVLRTDGTLQIADGNHRAWNAAAAGKTTIAGYIVSQENMPESAIVSGGEDEPEV